MNRPAKLFLTCILSILTLFTAAGQSPTDSLQTLEGRFTDLLKKSESYQEYKVVRRSTLNMFWAALSDSISTGNELLKAALVSKMDLRQQLNASQDSLNMVKGELEAYTTDSAQVSFLGIRMGQSFYNVLVWSLIVALAGLMFFFFQRFKQGHGAVKEVEEDRNKLQKEFDELRHKSKDLQIKLKRELQTALNKLEVVERN